MRCRLPHVLAVLLLAGAILLPRSASALDLKPGQPVAVAIEGLVAGSSIVSLIGNAVTIGRGEVNRGWLISGYVFGTLNTVISPLMLVYGRDPDAGFGLGMGAAHGVIGVANLALCIYGGVLWRRALRAESPLARLSLVPIQGLDSAGRLYTGAAVQVARF